MTAQGPRAQPRRRLAIPELHTLRELRHALARGSMPPVALRTPEDHARIAGFRVIQELLGLFEQFRLRVEDGERCRLVERKHARQPDRLIVELMIESEP